MKKLLKVIMCFTMVLFAGVALVGCGGAQTNDYITPAVSASIEGSSVKFANANDFSLEYKGKNHYVAKGSAVVMSAEQASAFGTSEGSKFVVVNVKTGKDASFVAGWRTAENKDTKFEQSEIDGVLVKNGSAKNDTKNFILALSEGQNAVHEDSQIWRVEVKGAGSEDVVSYTIDFSSFFQTQE